MCFTLTDFDGFILYRAEWVLKQLIQSPIEHLMAFKGLPQHFRKSELAELSQHNSFKISEWIKPKIDIDGITLKNIKIDPATKDIQRKFKADIDLDESDSKEINTDNQHLQNMRIFKITECSGVPLPEPSIASRIIDRKLRICLYLNGKPISNVFTIPAFWKSTEEDQWKFGHNLWKESMSDTVSEWNKICVAIEENVNSDHKIELFIELCITIKPPPNLTPVANQNANNNLNANPLLSPQSAKSNQGLPSQSQSQFNFRNSNNLNPTKPDQGMMLKNTEMSCGWAKLEIHSVDMHVSNGININHKLKIHGGTFNCESGIDAKDVRNDSGNALSFRKLKQVFSGVESVVVIQEQSYNNFKNSNKLHMKWIPENVITTVNSCRIIELYYELMADEWLRDQQIFEFQFFKQDLYQSLLLFIIDRPNLLCILIDEWKSKVGTFWRSQKKDRKFMINEFKLLLKQFVPFLVHKNIMENELASLNQERLSFIKQIVKGNVKQILYGNKPSSNVPLIYTPLTTDLFV